MSFVLAFVAGLTVGIPPERGDVGWSDVSDDDGIHVWRREVPGTSLVEFRGRGQVDANVLNLAAVLRDNDRKTEWMANCEANYAIRHRSATSAIVYHRVGSPAFFISARDVILDVKADWQPETKELTVGFFGTKDPKAPEPTDTVRMPKLEGYWKLKYVSPEKTEVTYQVFADPGGSLPKWLVNWASSDIPRHSIEGLREQVKKPGYDKDRLMVETAFDLTALSSGQVAGQPETDTKTN